MSAGQGRNKQRQDGRTDAALLSLSRRSHCEHDRVSSRNLSLTSSIAYTASTERHLAQ